jgi:hypothetical protein
MSSIITRILMLSFLTLFLSACNTVSLRSTEPTQLVTDSGVLDEQKLLDVGVIVFDPDVASVEGEKQLISSPEIRRAESRFMALRLSETLARNGGWGAVRVLPDQDGIVDLYINGKILDSNGERLKVEISVTDISGEHWYSKKYEYVTSKYYYSEHSHSQEDPFQSLYNQIANDLRKHRKALTDREIKNLRLMSELRFARNFSPEAFNEYLQMDEGENYQILRLPPDNDPLLQRVRTIRARDYLFIDTLQDHYSAFAMEMNEPYTQWRKQTYQEAIALRELRRQEIGRYIAGAALVIAGVSGRGSSSSVGRDASTVGILAGGYLIKQGYDKGQEKKIHAEALKELGSSLSAEIEPQVIALEDRTVTLTGTVDHQYQQWRNILREIYLNETVN